MTELKRLIADTIAGRGNALIEEAVFGYLGEGIADDLLQWLQQVADPETVAFVDSVIADEVGHEAAATKVLLMLTHVVAAAIVIPAIARRLSA